MKLQEFFRKLKFQPMSTIPDTADHSEDTEEWKARLRLPAGIVLRKSRAEMTLCKEKFGYTPSEYILLGNDIAGDSTSGCGCCGREWQDVIHRYDGWAWLPGLAD